MKRRYLVNARLRTPFDGYQRRTASSDQDAQAEHHPLSIFGPEHGLMPAEVRQADALLARAERERGRLKGSRRAARIAGIISAVKQGRVANRSWGLRMQGRHGGLRMARHAPHKLREISPKGVRASVIARAREGARRGPGSRAAAACVAPTAIVPRPVSRPR